jgi:hypothetical protein
MNRRLVLAGLLTVVVTAAAERVMSSKNILRRGIALIVAVAALSFHATAQSDQTAAPKTGVIAGRVVDAITGEPIAGARLNLNWVNPSPAVRAAIRDPRIPSPGLRMTDQMGRLWRG